ncbi:glycosyltransferase family 4 protein [Spongiactinospora sp. 9N601]|uniref:glycosyltransferase family 4 protein n=1 Tax=Spongiactinospora sp. 9N601 TaxID=3375149 RepID=UPI0037A532E3
MSVIAFCLLTYAPGEPAGIERSVAALMEGCRRLGHQPLVLTATIPGHPAKSPDIIPLRSLVLPRPIMGKHIREALDHPAPVVTELHRILREREVEVVCWIDALWGLGYLGAAPDDVRSVLMVHKIRKDDLFEDAIAAADLVCPISDYLLREATAAGLDTRTWRLIPNALLSPVRPVPAPERELLRRRAPVRIVSRAEPYKGLAELLQALPDTWTRPVEIVLAEAGFEYWQGMQSDVIEACQRAARARPEVVRLLPAMPWRAVPGFLAGACATVISSYEPETFCNTAAEALSVGTPVAGFSLGNLPYLIGAAGPLVPLQQGYRALWDQLAHFLEDPHRYHAAARVAPERVRNLRPEQAVATLLAHGQEAPNAAVRTHTR